MASNRRLKTKTKQQNAKVRAAPKVRRRDRFKSQVEAKEKKVEVKEKKPTPMPEGIERALHAMASLVKHLRVKQTGPVTVNVELLEVNGEYEWALQVRGIKPPGRWDGFRTLWNNQCKPVWSSEW